MVAERALRAGRLGVWGLALCACAHSPTVEYFALDGPTRMTAAPVAAAAPVPPVPAPPAGPALQIARVHVPAALDRRQMVRETAPFQVSISDTHRWGAPLDEMIRRTLSADLARLLPAGQVALPEQAVAAPTCRVVVDLLRFMPDPSGRTELQGTWAAMRDVSGAAGGATGGAHPIDITESMHSMSYAEQARAMSVALERLAAQIARHTPAC